MKRLSFFLVLCLASACGASDVIMLRSQGKEYRPDVAIVVRRDLVAPWRAVADSVPAWCFFRAYNLALVDGEVWALNGIARSGVPRDDVVVNGKALRIIDAWTGPQDRRSFASYLNDRMNAACP